MGRFLPSLSDLLPATQMSCKKDKDGHFARTGNRDESRGMTKLENEMVLGCHGNSRSLLPALGNGKEYILIMIMIKLLYLIEMLFLWS